MYALPYYLSVGMSYELFWEGDPYLAIIYRDVDMRRRSEMNVFAWMAGSYVYEAVSVVIHNAFGKKGSKPQYYPNEPHRITPETEEEKKAKARAEREKAINSFNAWKKAWDKTHV